MGATQNAAIGDYVAGSLSFLVHNQWILGYTQFWRLGYWFHDTFLFGFN